MQETNTRMQKTEGSWQEMSIRDSPVFAVVLLLTAICLTYLFPNGIYNFYFKCKTGFTLFAHLIADLKKLYFVILFYIASLPDYKRINLFS